ncbi:hypothetical protein D0T51_12050 [Parabacteroides sp. 52]|nr:hypothetical protein [Parabacteroides sp. PM5-20]NDV56452.1 hypothetical protein [Parabacteroides sp. 52]
MKVTKKDRKNKGITYIPTEIREITDITYRPIDIDLLREYLQSRLKQDKKPKKKSRFSSKK